MNEQTETQIAESLTRDQIETLRFLHDPMNMPEGSGFRVSIPSITAHSTPFPALIWKGLPRHMNRAQKEAHYRSLVELGLIHDRWNTSIRVPHFPGIQTTPLGERVLAFLGYI